MNLFIPMLKSASVYSFEENRLQHFLCLLSFQRNVKGLCMTHFAMTGLTFKGAEERDCGAE